MGEPIEDMCEGRPLSLTRREALCLAGGVATFAALSRIGSAVARQETPRSGERPVLKVGVTSITESLDPHLDNRNQRTLVTYSTFDGLLARDFLGGSVPGSGNGLLPALAESWQRLDDTTLELQLRQGVVFHDGSLMTADDVKFSLDLVLATMADAYPQAKSTLGEIVAVEAVDPETIRIITAAPDPILEMRLTTYAGWIVPRRAFEALGSEEFGLKPIGTGPYKIVEYRPDDALIVEAHDAYWGGTPPAARIEYRIIPETAARVAALVSGEVELINDVPPDQIPTLQTQAGIAVRGIPIANIRTINYNTRLPVMADVRFRQGLNLSIDRELIIRSLWSNQAVLPRGFQYADYGELYNPERPLPAYDPEEARRLIAESGYSNEPIALWYPVDTYTLGDEVTQAIVEMWRAVGINAEVKTMTLAEFYDNTEQKSAVSGSSNNEFADPDAWWIRWGKPSTVAKLLWTPEDPRFDALGEQARATLDQEFRFLAYQEMLDIFEAEAPGSVLYSPIENYGVRSDISWTPYALYYMDFRPGNLSF